MLSAAALARRLSAAGGEAAAPAGRAAGLTPAAVLVPIVARADPTVLLTLRNRNLRAHAGQVSFPGGRIEPTDADATAAALREMEEEIGLAPAAVQVVGRLGEHVTGTGFRITPVVGMLNPPLSLHPDPAEVDEVFELPLATVLDPGARSWREEVIRGRPRRFWVVRHEPHLIWGATAAILLALGEILGPMRDPMRDPAPGPVPGPVAGS